MSGSLNKAILIGRLGHDPEMRHTASGQPVVNFSIATDENYTSRDGQKVEKTEWHRIVSWGKQAEFCGNYLSKGSLVYIEGKIETRKWQDKNGIDKYTVEIKADRVVGLDSIKKYESIHKDSEDNKSSSKQDLFYQSSIIDDAPF